jgi:CBS domain-containing protein
MRVRDVMTRDLQMVSPQASLMEAAQQLLDWDVHSVPVCERGRLVGLIIDRDLTARARSRSFDPNGTEVRAVMHAHGVSTSPDDDVEDAARLMRERQLDRLPVVDQGKHLIGLLARDSLPATRTRRVVEDVAGTRYLSSTRR